MHALVGLYFFSRSSSIVRSMSLAIWRRRGGAISLPRWSGTVVCLPSGCLNWQCEPLCRISKNPWPSRSLITSRGLRTGMRPIPLNRDDLGSDVFCFQRRLPILHQHRDNLTQIRVKLIQRISLRMSPWETGDKTYKEARLRTFFNHRSKCTHVFSLHHLLTEGNIWFAPPLSGLMPCRCPGIAGKQD